MLSIHAKSPCELRAKLHDIAPQVPRRTESRRTEHCETWVSSHFLAAISRTDLLDYPLRVKSGDRPDLVLSFQSACTGIELTEAVSSNKAQVDAEAERNDIPMVPGYPYKPGEKKYPRQKIKNIAKGKIFSPPFMGDSIERDWVKVMLYFTEKKVEKFTQPEFTKYDRNWLLVYDNWSPYADLGSYPDVITDLDRQLFNCDWKNPFDKMFILRSHHVWEFSCNADAVKHPTLDLWQGS